MKGDGDTTGGRKRTAARRDDGIPSPCIGVGQGRTPAPER
ncbi:hypothetical protein BX257_7554 [Streptomyces sp. 3212.3]|nr:hypothetical protein BX257_7554 [Streptomyces sp. 3212.3]